jgi:hypothetical protein
METPILDRPITESSTPWPLSAPESYVLLHGPRAKSIEAFKRGLLELVARDVLRVETRERPRCFQLFTEQATFLHTGPNMSRGELVARPLQAIWDIYRRTSLCISWGDPRGVLVRDLPRSARGLGTPLGKFTYWSVLPALVERGLYERDDYAAPGPSRSSRYTETTAGRAERVKLESLMWSAVRDFYPAAQKDPAAALALAGGLGSAIFLMDPLLSEITSIGQRIRDGITIHLGLNTASLDLDFDVLDPGALDKLGGVFEALGDMGSGWHMGGGDGDSGGGGDSGGWGDGDGGGGWGDGGGGD